MKYEQKPIYDETYEKYFVFTGEYRYPKDGEYFWYKNEVIKCILPYDEDEDQPELIMAEVPAPKKVKKVIEGYLNLYEGGYTGETVFETMREAQQFSLPDKRVGTIYIKYEYEVIEGEA